MQFLYWKALNLALKTKNSVLLKSGWRHPQGRPQGRPHCAWVDDVKEYIAARLDALMCLAADRQAWTSLRYGPCGRPRVHDIS